MLRWIALSLLAVCSEAAESPAYTPAQLAALPVSDWITNGGNIHNQRLFPLARITGNQLGSLNAQWSNHFNGRRVGAPVSGEAQPIVRHSVLYVPTRAPGILSIKPRPAK